MVINNIFSKVFCININIHFITARQDIYDVDENDILEEEDEEEDEGNEKEDRRGDQTRFRGFSFMNLTHLASANTDE